MAYPARCQQVDSARGKLCTLTEEVGRRLRIIFQRTASFNLASALLETFVAQVAVGCTTAYFCFRAQISITRSFQTSELEITMMMDQRGNPEELLEDDGGA